MITLENVTQSYGDKVILKDINLTIKDGSITAIVGSNGSGKSTLLKAISKLIPIKTGDILIDNESIYNTPRDMAKTVAMLRQNHQINLKLKSYDLIAFGRYPHSKGRLTKDCKNMIEKTMEYLEIDHLANRFIDTLSGGELQRVLLAMILVQDTKYILLDEPLNHLDLHYSLDMMKLLKRFIKDFNKTVVIIMHDINMAAAYCDYGVAMKYGEIAFQGTMDDLMTSDTLSHIYDYPIRVETVNSCKVCVYFNKGENNEKTFNL
jgi:iron complex transport system ATP-binding protein